MKESNKGYEKSPQEKSIEKVICEGARRMLQVAIETKMKSFL